MDNQIFKKSKDKSEITIQKKQQKEKELVGNIFPYENHKIFEINDLTYEVQLAKFEIQKTFILNKSTENKSIIIRNGYSYVSALNKKNALKKFRKGDNGSKPIYLQGKIKLF